MPSNINPNNIDGAYPVAGQDNDSQGFRDNFTNTRLNFVAAANEITDLQGKAILSAPLVGTVNPPVPWVNNLGGSVISNGLLKNMRYTVSAVQTGTTATIDFSQNSYWRVKPTGNCVISFANIPTASQWAQIRIDIDTTDGNFNVASNTVTFTGSVVPSGEVQGLDGNVLTFNQTGVFSYEANFISGAGNLGLVDLSRNRDPMYLPSAQLFSANGNINVAVTTTVIVSDADLVGNLASGIEGQIKILAYGNASTGNCLVTVEDAAWGGSELANLSAVGSAATLQYINGQWFCVGNNGVTFS
jgi:hypothetical protein